MRKLILASALLAAACDPTIRKFTVVPEQLQCGGKVTLEWQGDADGGRIQADQPVTPPLPDTVLNEGTLSTSVTQTTTFTYFFPSAAHREKTVTVAGGKDCGGTGPGPTPCNPVTVTLTGTCTSAQQGPSYISVNVSAAQAPGALENLTTDADFPVHVQHAGETIPLAPGGGPLFALPNVPAAGDYTIIVPGDAGLKICAEAGPTAGSTEAPTVHLTITPACPAQ